MSAAAFDMIAKLVSFATVSRDSNLELIEYVSSYLAEHGVESRLVPNADKSKANLFATIGPMVEGGVWHQTALEAQATKIQRRCTQALEDVGLK